MKCFKILETFHRIDWFQESQSNRVIVGTNVYSHIFNLSSSKVTDCVPKLYCRVSVSRCVCASHSSDVQVFYTSFAWLLQLKSLIFWLQVLQTANFTSNCHFKVTLWIKNKNLIFSCNSIISSFNINECIQYLTKVSTPLTFKQKF